MFVPEKYVVTFKPGKEMEERVRRMIQEAESRGGESSHEPPHSGNGVDEFRQHAGASHAPSSDGQNHRREPAVVSVGAEADELDHAEVRES